MQDDNPVPDDRNAPTGADPQVAHLLAAAARRRKKAAGPEPAELMELARWVDGELPANRRAEVAALVAANPELRATVDTLATHDDKSVRGSEAGTRLAPTVASPASNVISLADHARRAAADKRGKAEHATGRAASRVLIGGGSVLLLAAILFLATRPTSQSPTSLSGAAVGAGGTIGLRASFATQPTASSCEVSGVLSAEAPQTLWYATLEGATSLGEVPPGPFRLAPRCAASACEALVATPIGAVAPTLDPASCAPSDSSLTSVRLTR